MNYQSLGNDSIYRSGWNVKDEYQSYELDKLRLLQKQSQFPYAVCALNVCGDLNIGIIIRNACIMGAERVFVLGRRKYDKRSTVGAHNYIDIVREDCMKTDMEVDSDKVLTILYDYGYNPIFVELGGTDLHKFDMSVIPNPCFVFGNEGFGIPSDMLKSGPIVSIPQRGVLRSLNVSTSSGIVLNHVMCYFLKKCG